MRQRHPVDDVTHAVDLPDGLHCERLFAWPLHDAGQRGDAAGDVHMHRAWDVWMLIQRGPSLAEDIAVIPLGAEARWRGGGRDGFVSSRRLRRRRRLASRSDVRAAHRQNGAWSRAHDALGHAAHEHVRQPSSAMRPHDD